MLAYDSFIFILTRVFQRPTRSPLDMNGGPGGEELF